jgi:excisionase family DNA binding protein
MKECSEYLGLSIKTLYQWTHQKKIPHYKFGKLVKFDLKDLEIWIKRKKVKPLWKIEV